MMLRRIDAVVPAHDEEDLVGASIDALLVAGAVVLAHRPGLEVGVVIVLDDCRDDTARIVRERLARGWEPGAGGVVVSVTERSVGAARGAGVAAALQLGDAADDERWIANSDADSRVPADWFVAHMAAFDAGVDVLLGTVRPDFDEFSERDVQHWLATHPAGHLPGNVHGANLGVRADRLRQLGGFGAMPEHEDVDLVARARAAGLRIVPTLDGMVTTSARRRGRTPGGYAAFLAAEYPLAASS
ncbi:glycosyltransferase family 2 protein [Plantibacter flavus]|uniref:glycosyltransferase n=1 Tax=Plantibacter flavus TaxID=150123 RepID=UPI003F169852